MLIQVGCCLSRKHPVVGLDQFGQLVQYRDRVPGVIADAYVGLHHHDEFSIRDGLGTVGQLVKLLQAQRRSFCCITNHGSVGGWIKQYNACKKAGIKAIFGMEAYVSNYRGDDMEQKKAHRSANHLVLLAATEEGFYNIIRIHNDAQLNGFYYSPRVNWEACQKWGKGVIAMSACMKGEIPSALMADREDLAQVVWGCYSKAFDSFYVELQVIEHEDQREANRRMIQFARKVGAPLVLTCDSHYLDPSYSEAHDILMCLRQGKTITDKKERDDVWSFDVRNLYYRDAEAMRRTFEQGFVDEDGNEHAPFRDDVFTEDVFREALSATRQIAMRVDLIVLDSTIKLPKLYEDSKGILRQKANAGFVARGLHQKPERDEYLARINYEFKAITRMGWADYFLVMERIISDTKAKFGEWAIGYGRGCFHPASRVVMGDGMPKFIGNVKVGDVVVSHDGSRQRVVDTFEYEVDEDLVEVTTADGRVFRCTPEHGVFIQTPEGMKEVQAKDLKEGDDVVEVR
jgi:DNA polymerase-3 subunit alpha